MRRIVSVLFLVTLVSITLCDVGCSETDTKNKSKNGTEKIQYNGYEWGMEKNKIVKMIKNNDYEVLEAEELELNNNPKYISIIGYKDEVYDKKFKVIFSFPGITNKLFGVVILFDELKKEKESKKIYNKFDNTFHKKYGNDIKEIKENEYRHIWETDKNRLVLKYIEELKCIEEERKILIAYTSKKYKRLFEEEKKEMIKQEKKENKEKMEDF